MSEIKKYLVTQSQYFNNQNRTDISIELVLDSMNKESVVKDICDGLRSGKLSKDEIEEWKKRLPYVTLSGTWYDNFKASSFIPANVELMQIDIDSVADVEQAKKALASLPYMIASFVSPSGNGVKGIARIKRGQSNFLHVWRSLTNDILKVTGLKNDVSTKNINRLMFYSYDPDVMINWNAVPFDAGVEEVKKKGKSSPDNDIERIKEALKWINPDAGYDVWLRVGMALHSFDFDALPIFDEWSKSSKDYDQKELANKWYSFESEKQKGITKATIFAMARERGWDGKKKVVIPECVLTKNEETFRKLTERFEQFQLGSQIFYNDTTQSDITYITQRTLFEITESQAEFPYEVVVSDKYSEFPNAGKEWIKWCKDIKKFKNGIVFDPTEQAKECINLWKGFAIKPEKGDCSLFMEFIKDIVCNKNEELYDFTLNWIAYMYQNLGVSKAPTALVLLGKQGTGKSFFASAIGKPLGKHFYYVEDKEKVLGRFNNLYEDKILIYLDEAFLLQAQDAAKMKMLISSDSITIEHKGVNPRQAKSYANFIISTDQSKVVKLDIEERRYCILSISNEKMQDRSYFSKLANHLEHGGYEAFFHDMLHRKVKRSMVEIAPETEHKTEEAVEQMRHSQPEMFWLYERILYGFSWTVDKSQQSKQNPDVFELSGRIVHHDLYEDYKQYLKDNSIRKDISKPLFGKFLKQFSEVRKSNSVTYNIFPSLSATKDKFLAVVGLNNSKYFKFDVVEEERVESPRIPKVVVNQEKPTEEQKPEENKSDDPYEIDKDLLDRLENIGKIQ